VTFPVKTTGVTQRRKYVKMTTYTQLKTVG